MNNNGNNNTIVECLSVVLTSLGTFITAYLGYKLKKQDVVKKDEVNFLSHPVFLKLAYNKTVITSYFSIKNKGKETIFKEILSIHMDIYNKACSDFAAKMNANDIKNEMIYTESINALSYISKNLTTFYKGSDNYSDEEKKVLDIVMAKYVTWNRDRENEVNTRLSEICNSEFYPNKNSKVVAILDAFMTAANDTVIDSSRTLNCLNGDLKGLVFRGVSI